MNEYYEFVCVDLSTEKRTSTNHLGRYRRDRFGNLKLINELKLTKKNLKKVSV